MKTYLFKTSEFGISQHGIHLLRSGFNYRTIPYHDIESITIRRGRELHNWFVIFVIGAALLVGGLVVEVNLLDQVFYQGKGSGKAAAFFFLLPFVGAYFVFSSVQTGLLLEVEETAGKKQTFLLAELIARKEVSSLRDYLKSHVTLIDQRKGLKKK